MRAASEVAGVGAQRKFDRRFQCHPCPLLSVQHELCNDSNRFQDLWQALLRRGKSISAFPERHRAWERFAPSSFGVLGSSKATSRAWARPNPRESVGFEPLWARVSARDCSTFTSGIGLDDMAVRPK
jgi:hypothetical protein